VASGSFFSRTSPEPSTEAEQQPANEIPAEFTAKVIKVIDGDTIDVLTDDTVTIRIRLNGIDCPERGQPFGNNARETVSASIGGQMVRIVTHGDDRYGRIIGDIYHDGTLINLTLVKAGMAWHYVKYAPDNTAFAEAEQQAREIQTGLWRGSHKPIAPWDWRRMSKDERDGYR
jgi:micrococcal nuclease